MQAIRVLVVEDHAVVRSGLRLLIEAEPDMEVVGEAGNGQEAIQQALAMLPDVILMDISMQGMNGLEAAQRLKETLPKIAVLMLSMHEDEEYFFQSLQAGALGYVPKSAPDAEVLAGIRSVAMGHSYLHPSVARLLVNDYLERTKPGDVRPDDDCLTEREREVLRLVAEGYNNREIAQQLSLSVHTVHNHRSRLMEKLGAHDRVELLKYAVRKGMLDLD